MKILKNTIAEPLLKIDFQSKSQFQVLRPAFRRCYKIGEKIRKRKIMLNIETKLAPGLEQLCVPRVNLQNYLLKFLERNFLDRSLYTIIRLQDSD